MAGRQYNRNARRNTGRGQTTYRRTAYLEGTAARQLQEAYDVERVPERKRLSNTTRKNREKAFHMNLGYVLFLTAALSFSVFMLCGYIRLQSDITNTVATISKMEAEYNNLKLENDEEYNRISSSMDLEKIKAVAIGELGMSYAREGQIVNVENSETDYVRQVDDLH